MEGRNLLRGVALAAVTGLAMGCAGKAETVEQQVNYFPPVVENNIPATVTLVPTETPTFTPTVTPTPEPTHTPKPEPTRVPEKISVKQPVKEIQLTEGEKQLINEINRIRNQNGRVSLSVDSDYMNFARAKTYDMASKSYFSHRDALGRELYVDSIYAYCNNPLIGGNFAAENLGRTQDPNAINAVIKGWLNSSDHAYNLFDPLWNNIGVGISNSSDGFTYISFLGAKGGCIVK